MNMNTRDMVILSLITAQAVVLHYVEGFFPVIAPGAKLGLANIMTIVTLYVFSAKHAFVVLGIRVLLGSLLSGNPMGILFSMVGGILSWFIMSILKRHPKHFSLVGVSTAGAAFHNLGQLATASIIYNTIGIFFTYLPILMLTSVITGFFIGVASHYMIDYLEKHV